MTEYKDTLNLPKTDFPMKANLAQREPAMLKRWEEQKLYQQIRQHTQGREQFILHDGPPYANGDIHLGHAVNKVLKDIIIKAKTLQGYDAPYVPGWDCHGLPIELNVEKKVGKPGIKVSASEFRKACRDYANSQINNQRQGFKRLGVLGDWENPYMTMAYQFEADIIRSLGKIIANGHLQQGFKPVHWCMDCGSALAEAEVEYHDKKSPAIDVKFIALDEEAFLERIQPKQKGEGDIVIPIWTTTPWTLPANQAVALNPKLNYVLIQYHLEHHVERLLLAEELHEAVLQRYGISDYQIIGHCLGEVLEGLKLQHPFYERVVPVILGDHVTVDAGTGAVHTAPGHGQEDYVAGAQYHLPIDSPVDGRGCFLPNTPLFAGKHVLQANDEVIEVLKAHGNLLHHEALNHSYPHCWRHKTPLIFRATPQWFISMDKKGLRQAALAAINHVQWIPEWGQARIVGMIEKRPDWCISRQRAWGVPIAVFVHKETKQLHPDSLILLEKAAELVEQQGIEAWFELAPESLLGAEAAHYEKVIDILDVWFDSGVSHNCVLQRRDDLRYPADLYLEGSDQHRGWFQTSLLSAMAMHGQAPFRQVLTHGFTIDAQGRKMSKSLGNTIEPDKVMKTMGADILRLWIASVDYRAEITLSDEILNRIADAYRRIRNTLRFLLANLHDFEPAKHSVVYEERVSLDRWAVDRAELLQDTIAEAYEQYQFHQVYQKLQHFCSIDMGSFYLDVIKDRQYTCKTDSLARRSAQTSMYYIAEVLVKCMAPILSFTAEEVWQYMPGQRSESIFLTEVKASTSSDIDPSFQIYWERMIKVREWVNKEIEQQRHAGLIGAGLEAEISLYADGELYQQLLQLGDELRFVLITSSAKVLPLENIEKAIVLDNGHLQIQVAASSHAKCARCWHRRSDIGTQAEHPEICGRCIENIVGQGEQREFA
ncbi:MAG: isoleucyl-tRNA synthetase [Gammaproteobacteria bacterium]|jgi:isoleucyl-tRNA synthetase|nr:isoleucyl-tRNA synthetase [Gammaproteobacteria bacterium]